jgi:ABC-2 type transport system ATP-binding protein
MITVEHLTKCYGDFTAVDDLSFEIEEGHVYGFLGPNGAGKSTTMNIMTGCLSATEGHVRIDGYDIFEEPQKAKKLIGYLPEQPPLYMSETPAEYLRFVGEAKGLKGEELTRQIEEVMEQTKITDVRNRRISALSKGYKQRVGIAQALIGNPKVIILDEPTVGLDPIQIIEIRDLIRQLGQSHTVILSSHILSEVQTICEKILIIAKGKLLAFDEPENLENRLLAPNEITFTAEATVDEVTEILSGIANLTEIEPEEKGNGLVTVHLKTDRENIYDVSRELFFAFADKKRALLEMSLKKANLEDIFIELTENKDSEQPEATEALELPEQPAPENDIESEEEEA